MARKGNRHAQEGRTASRKDEDWWITPPEMTQALLDREVFPGRVWEPACGDGSMAKVITAAGYECIASDLHDRGYGDARMDFLLTTNAMGDSIITNPPFNLGTEFARHALSLKPRKIALLCRVAFLAGDKRGQFVHPALSRVWIFSHRHTLRHGNVSAQELEDRKARGAMEFAWFVYERHHTGGAQVRFIP